MHQTKINKQGKLKLFQSKSDHQLIFKMQQSIMHN